MKLFCTTALLLLFAVTAPHLTAATAPELPADIASPQLAKLAKELLAVNTQALETFWTQLQGKAPLIEPIEGDPRHCRVTFIWRGTNDITRVSMIRGLPGPNLLKPLARLLNTDLWFRTEIHSTEARFQYVFQINGPETVTMELPAIMEMLERNPPRPDPLNPHKLGNSSYVELLHAPMQPWLKKRRGIPSGAIKSEKFKSQLLKAERPLTIYQTPPPRDDGVRSWLVIAFDGASSARNITLDNLIDEAKIPPMVVIGVENLSSQSRQQDLDCSDDFAAFLATELVPWARRTFRVYDDPAHTIVAGTSLGGKMAAYCGLKHSDVFGKVLSQSGTFITPPRQESPTPIWEGESPGLLSVQFAHSPRLPLEFYIEVGRYETTLPFSPLLETRNLRNVLEAKGYPITYSEFVGDHSEVCWRGSFADALIALTAER